MSDTYSCGCGSTSTITIPCCPSTPGATGATGANGGVILYNDFEESEILGVNSWQNFYIDKSYDLSITQLSSIGDRLIVESRGQAQMPNISNKYIGAKLLFDNNDIATIEIPMSHTSTVYFKFITTFDVIESTNESLNIRSYTRCEYAWNNPSIAMTTGSFSIEYKDVTIDYATSPAKILKMQGILVGTTIDITNFVKIDQFCVEYFKKI